MDLKLEVRRFMKPLTPDLGVFEEDVGVRAAAVAASEDWKEEEGECCCCCSPRGCWSGSVFIGLGRRNRLLTCFSSGTSMLLRARLLPVAVLPAPRMPAGKAAGSHRVCEGGGAACVCVCVCVCV